MAKRFTDNEKWKDAWFMDLPSKYKLFWLYILDECNHAGIWKVNFKIASFHIGEHLEYSECTRILKNRINILSDEYWYIEKFIFYQYNCKPESLNKNNKVHNSILKILIKYDFFKGLGSPLLGAKEKDKEKDKDILDNNIIINNEIFKKNSLKDKQWLEVIAMQNKIKIDVIKLFLTTFENHLITMDEQKKSLKDFKSHFVYWLAKQNLSQFRIKKIGKTNQV